MFTLILRKLFAIYEDTIQKGSKEVVLPKNTKISKIPSSHFYKYFAELFYFWINEFFFKKTNKIPNLY